MRAARNRVGDRGDRGQPLAPARLRHGARIADELGPHRLADDPWLRGRGRNRGERRRIVGNPGRPAVERCQLDRLGDGSGHDICGCRKLGLSLNDRSLHNRRKFRGKRCGRFGRGHHLALRFGGEFTGSGEIPQRQDLRLARIGHRGRPQQMGNARRDVFRAVHRNPFAHPHVDLIGRDILRHHHPRFAPAPVEGIGIGQVLAGLGTGVAIAHRVGKHLHSARGFTRQSIGEAQVASGNGIAPVAKQFDRRGVVAPCGFRQSQPEHGRRAFVTQVQRVVEGLRRRGKPSGGKIGGTQRGARCGIARCGLNRPLGLGDGLAALASERLGSIAGGPCAAVRGAPGDQRDGDGRGRSELEDRGAVAGHCGVPPEVWSCKHVSGAGRAWPDRRVRAAHRAGDRAPG